MTVIAFLSLWGTIAIGAGAVSVPIIIHLLNRKRYRVVVWAAMRFLLMAQKQTTRRMRLEQILLLALRCLLVLLIVLAMASVTNWAEEDIWKPLFPEGAAASGKRTGRTHKILVLDGSLSMAVKDKNGKTAFEHARERAIEIVRNSGAGDGFNVLLMKDPPRWIIAEPSLEGDKVIEVLQGITLPHGNANVPSALNLVAAKLTEPGNRFDAREVYFLTDLQRATWSGETAPAAGGDKESKGDKKDGKERNVFQQLKDLKARTILVDVGRDKVTNVAVTDLSLDDPLITTGALVPVKATIQNFGPEERHQFKVELRVGKSPARANEPFQLIEIKSDTLTLKPGERRTLTFAHRFSTAGTYAVQVRTAADALELDDQRSLIVPVRETLPTLLVNGKPAPAGEPFDAASEYLRLALNPFEEFGRGSSSKIRPTVVSVPAFLSNDPKLKSNLADYDCVFLCDVASLRVSDLRRLETHLRRGGGLIICLGDNTASKFDAVNELLFKRGQGLLPARLKDLKKTGPYQFHFEPAAFQEPPLKAFVDDDDRSTLRSPRFRQYVEAEPAVTGAVRKILSFRPEKGADQRFDHPAVLEWNPPLPASERAKQAGGPPAFYRGKVVLITSTVNLDWNNWPGSPSFPAFMQELVRFAVSGKVRPHAETVGDVLEEFFQAGGPDVKVRLRTPSLGDKGKPIEARTQGSGDLAVFRWAATDQSGLYRLTVGEDPQEYLFAVNVPTTTSDKKYSESDLTRVTKEQLQTSYRGMDFNPRDKDFQLVTKLSEVVHAEASLSTDDSGREKVGPVIAHYALLAVLVILFLEVVLAWAFGHYSKVTGVAEPPRVGKLWPSIVGGTAAVLVLVIGGTLIHAAYTGDFLGFLPDGFRAGIERTLGIPPPAPGESTRWTLEHTPYLLGTSSDSWLIAGLALIAVALVVGIYLHEPKTAGGPYKALLGCLRVCLIVFALVVLLPQLQIRFQRQGWPEVILIIDDSLSMGKQDPLFRDESVEEKARTLGEHIKAQLLKRLSERINALQAKLDEKKKTEGDDERIKAEIKQLEQQTAKIKSSGWRPNRLQLAQALLTRDDPDWIDYLLNERRMKVHVYHLDGTGRLDKLKDEQGVAGDVIDPTNSRQRDRARMAIGGLEAHSNDTRLGVAIRQAIDQFRASSVSAVIVLTDGIVTQRELTLRQAATFAAEQGVPLLFVGIGDEYDTRELTLEVQAPKTVYVGDRVIFEAQLTGRGPKNLKADIVLKLKEKTDKDKDGRDRWVEKELTRKKEVKLDEKIQLVDQPKKAGRRQYIVQVDLPRGDGEEGPPARNLIRPRTVIVEETKLIKVFYVEGTARYEYRFVKGVLDRQFLKGYEVTRRGMKLMEIESVPKDTVKRLEKLKGRTFTTDKEFLQAVDGVLDPRDRGRFNKEILHFCRRRSVELDIALADAQDRQDAQFHRMDECAAIWSNNLPDTKADLWEYDVVIIGDVDPFDRRLGVEKLKDLADFVRIKGGGLLMMAGTAYSPHAYKDTHLADVLPIEMIGPRPVEPEERPEGFRLELTAAGRSHPIFRFVTDENQNLTIWQRLAPLYWWSQAYRIKPAAEVLAVHPKLKAAATSPKGADDRHPLAVQQFVGAGRSLFYGFDESWRWRFREDELRFNQFWIETVRHLARGRRRSTELRLDRQSEYEEGEAIKVFVEFPDNLPPELLPDEKGKDAVLVEVQYRPTLNGKEVGTTEIDYLRLTKVANSRGSYEGIYTNAREGNYRFTLLKPDVSKHDPDEEKPTETARVLPPLGEKQVTMEQEKMQQAARLTGGQYYTLANADDLLRELPEGTRVLVRTPRPPVAVWNHLFCFAVVLLLLGAEWILRKRKHLL